MTRQEVYEVVDSERAYQDRKWGGASHDGEHRVAEWLSYIREYLIKAEKEATTNTANALEEIRKITALGVACMENLNTPKREL